MEDANKKNPYQDTLNLKVTDFSIRANAAIKEPEILKFWHDTQIYKKSGEKNFGNQKFVLPDGPPYANGHIHMGHVLNKVLKDLVTKSKRMAGYYTYVKPGWDCHGLPIEHKVLSELASQNKLDRVQFKKLCRDFVNNFIKIQKEEFKGLGVIMDWDDPYITMKPEYEALILKAFAKFVEYGFIERKGKTVPWCPTCNTVLAVSAEIEYKDRKDPSIYVLFELDKSDSKKLFADILDKNPDLNINFLVWTTTPWTLPLNRAVVLNPDAQYLLLDYGKDNLAFIVAQDLADQIVNILKIEKKILAKFNPEIFKNYKINHPFITNLKVPVLLDKMVTLQDGTACLHSAPGCGPEDYLLGLKYNLEIFSPLSGDGKYTQNIEPKELINMSVVDGQIWVIKKLAELGRLLHKASITHSYPHCWRCRNGLIFRATEQWFCDLQKNNLVEKTLKEIDKIEFFPDWGKSRLQAFVGNRPEWCVSRQKIWGVPIVAIICKKCGTAHTDYNLIENIAIGVSKEGIEYWDKLSIKDIFDQNFLSKNFKCSKCANSDINSFKKETDILDVWFDSGISHYAVLAQDEKRLGVPADLYLEGSDQHRGWFQSSLLTSMVLNNKSQTKQILTHGFVVDEKGYKMSKSLGNVIAPEDMIKKYSRDILRLWVASSNYQNDIALSENILKNVSEVYRKIRNTTRFMIANLYDFDYQKDTVSFENLLILDKLALINLQKISDKVLKAYKDYDFATAYQTINNYCANDLSALYLDVLKDRLYIEKADGLLRRSGQTAMFVILDTITRLMAPILSFLAEEVYSTYKKDNNSIHLQDFNNLNYEVTLNYSSEAIWNLLLELRAVVLKSIEEKRVQDIVKHSLEAKIKIYFDKNNEQYKLLEAFIKDISLTQDYKKFFKDFFIVSQIEFVEKLDDLNKTDLSWVYVSVDHADGVKCPRCWQWSIEHDTRELCVRCSKLV